MKHHPLNWSLLPYLWANSEGCLFIIFKRRHQSRSFQIQVLTEQVYPLIRVLKMNALNFTLMPPNFFLASYYVARHSESYPKG